jgi:hypothetical protein
MKRSLTILIALLVIQLILIGITYWPQSSQAEAIPVFADVSNADVAALTLSDNNGNQVRLTRQAGAWVLPDAGDYPALDTNVNNLLDKLLVLKTERLITQTPASHARLQVADDDFLRRTQIETQDGKATTLYFGSSPSAGATHFRVGGEDSVYLTGGLTSFDIAVQPAPYIDTTYVHLSPSEVTKLEVRNAQGTLDFEKDADGTWTLARLTDLEPLDTTAVQGLVNRASNMTLARPVGTQDDPACQIAETSAEVLLTTTNEGVTNTYTIKIGPQNERGQVLVSYSEADYCVDVAEFNVSDFVNKAATDFVLEPTPQANMTPAP